MLRARALQARACSASSSSAAGPLAPPRKRRRCVEAEPLLPFGLYGEAIRTHPAVRAAAVDSHLVHAAWLESAHDVRTEAARGGARALVEGAHEAKHTAPRRTDCTACPECGGYLVDDARNGVLVCDACGLVPHRGQQTRGDARSSLAEPDGAREQGARDQGARDGARLLARVQALTRGDDELGEERRRRLHAELEHWNHFVGLGEDALRAVSHRMHDRTGRTSVKDDAARAIGYLLDRRLGSDEAAVRAALKRGEACTPALLARPVPSALSFVCRHCRATQNCAKAARHHCRRR